MSDSVHHIDGSPPGTQNNINQIKSVGSKMTSQIQVNLNPQSVSQKTHPEVAGQLQGTVKRQRSGWFPNGWDDPPNSLAYEFTLLTKPSQASFYGLSPCPLQMPIPCRVCFSLNPNKSTSYLSLCLSLNFCNETSEPELHGFWSGSRPRRDS